MLREVIALPPLPAQAPLLSAQQVHSLLKYQLHRQVWQQNSAIDHVIELLIADEERGARAGRQNEDAAVEELTRRFQNLILYDQNESPTVTRASLIVFGQQNSAIDHVIELLIADEERGARAGRQNEDAAVEELTRRFQNLILYDQNESPTVTRASLIVFGQQNSAIDHVIELLIADEERGARAGRQNEDAAVEELTRRFQNLILYDQNESPTVTRTSLIVFGQQNSAIDHVIELLIADEERGARAGRQNEDAAVEELTRRFQNLILYDQNESPTVTRASLIVFDAESQRELSLATGSEHM
ncbi:hypothetical protein ACJMK2_018224 [Sinanodonta woodiana]|uniref:Uncharacterized protein n=1 Tax=Sinanodonta woodiana TaxID=1069815 RepID=A0ABD3UCS3_SINWO